MPGKNCRSGRNCRAIPSLSRSLTSLPRGKTCLSVLGTVCRSITPSESRSAKKSRAIRRLFVARGVARGLLTRLRDHLDEHMIAQPILTTGPKPPAQQQQQQHAPTASDFQSLLSPTDSSLMDLGASAIATHLP